MVANYITNEESELVKSYAILPIIMTMFERDKAIMIKTLKTPTPYIYAIDDAMDRASVMLREIRQEFRKCGIKVYEVERTKDCLIAKYACRGYTGQMDFLWPFVRSEVETRMSSLLGVDITKDLAGKPREIVQETTC